MLGLKNAPEPQNKSIKLVLFDWSGVISKDMIPVYRANEIILENFGKKMPPFQEWLGGIAKQTPVEFFRSFGINKDASTLHNLYAATYAQVNSREGIRPVAYEDAKRSLEKLSSKVGIMVISAHPENALIEEAEAYGVAKCFTNIIGSVVDKSECIYRIAHTQLKLKRSEVIYAGDMTFDIESARNGEVLSAAIATGYSTRKALEDGKPDFIFDSMTEFVEGIGALLRK